MDKVTQCSTIREYLRIHGNASVRELFINCNVNSPRKRISELNASGVPIGSFLDYTVDDMGHKTRYKRFFIQENKK